MGTFVVLSDIHGNYEAFKSVISDAVTNFGKNIDGFLFLGDYCCDFLEGEECIRMINALKKYYPVYAISGNRESNMVLPYKKKMDNQEPIGWDINSTMGVPLLSCQRLSKEAFAFVENLQDSMLLEFDGLPPLYLQHKMPLSPEKQEFLEQKGVRHILTAHTHEPHSNTYGNFTMFNPGSVGLTDTGLPGAYYGLLSFQDGDWNMKYRCIPYDYKAQINRVNSNKELMEKCKNWGVALQKSIETGVNVTALYMFEVNRMAEAIAGGESLEDHISFSLGRYGNVSPINTPLEVSIEKDGEVVTYFYKTDEFKPKKDPVPKPDWIYPVVLNKVINELNAMNNISDVVVRERLDKSSQKKV